MLFWDYSTPIYNSKFYNITRSFDLLVKFPIFALIKIQYVELTTRNTKRKTFGIISHPDAGKTTLTEKLLLFGGAIQEAGAVKAIKLKRGYF